MDSGDWRDLTRRAVALVGTPCFIVVAPVVRDALDELERLTRAVQSRHWLSLKTLPIRPLLEQWRDWGMGVEVVSPYELGAAVQARIPPERILVNGLAKHRWLADAQLERLNVHFDSLTEVRALKHIARASGWRVGLRHQVDGDSPGSNQFGMTAGEMAAAVNELRTAGVEVDGVHFHIRSSIGRVNEFAAALQQTRRACHEASFEPGYVDIGGGLPVSGEAPVDGVASALTFDLEAWSDWLTLIPKHFPHAQEIWLENGRFITARAGALVVTVLDQKERSDANYLICDGGRTNHARMSALEAHELVVDPERDGDRHLAVVCGPTCGTPDRLGRFLLPDSVQIGDRLMWMNAGAYALPLETRFSFGLAPVIWFDLERRPSVIRQRETVNEWWAQWS